MENKYKFKYKLENKYSVQIFHCIYVQCRDINTAIPTYFGHVSDVFLLPFLH